MKWYFVFIPSLILCGTLYSSVNAAPPTQENEILKKEWLFQTEEKPTLESVKNELKWTSELIERLEKMPTNAGYSANTVQKTPSWEEEKKALSELQKKYDSSKSSDAPSLYFEVRTLKRAVFF